jgi:hypothetical protein
MLYFVHVFKYFSDECGWLADVSKFSCFGVGGVAGGYLYL